MFRADFWLSNNGFQTCCHKILLRKAKFHFKANFMFIDIDFHISSLKCCRKL